MGGTGHLGFYGEPVRWPTQFSPIQHVICPVQETQNRETALKRENGQRKDLALWILRMCEDLGTDLMISLVSHVPVDCPSPQTKPVEIRKMKFLIVGSWQRGNLHDVWAARHNTVMPQNLWLLANFLPSDFIVTSAHFMNHDRDLERVLNLKWCLAGPQNLRGLQPHFAE